MSAPSNARRVPGSLRFNIAHGKSLAAGAGLTLGLSTLMLAPAAVAAKDAADASTKSKSHAPKELPEVSVPGFDPNPNGQSGVPYKAITSGDDRHTRPLAELPQNIAVITKAAIDDSGDTDLRNILDNQPGITVGTGENGNAFGDRYVIRGQEARSDVFVDGLRDPGMTTRESFAIEQLEISKGPNSGFAGRGTSGGAVNAITKQATSAYNFATVSTTGGSDSHARVTLDANRSSATTSRCARTRCTATRTSPTAIRPTVAAPVSRCPACTPRPTT